MGSSRPPDADALAEHAAFVRAVARAALGGDDAVEDVVQDTYAAALQSGPRKPGALRAWLAGVARRQAAARIRRRVLRRRAAANLPTPARGDSTLDVATRVETSRRVVEAVLALEEPYRSAILLRYWDDLPPREIARRKEVPVETARTWVKRGLKQLRARLEREHGSGRNGWRAVLLPLAVWPGAGAPLAATGVFVGVLAMKKVAAIVIVLLLVAGGVLWWRGAQPVEREPVASPTVPNESEAPPLPPSSSATLTGRTEREPAVEPVADAADAPYRGRVLDPDGRPLAGVRVIAPIWYARTSDGRWSIHYAARGAENPAPVTVTDAVGRFAFPVTPPGTTIDPERPCVALDAYASVEGLVPGWTRVEQGKEALLRLYRGGTLEVRVVDEEGSPVEGAAVQIEATGQDGPAAHTNPSPLRTAEDGRGSALLAEGGYRLHTRAAGHAPAMVDGVEVHEGKRTEQRIALGTGVEIAVRVVGEDEEPVAGALVQLAGPQRSTARGVTDDEGRCVVREIAPPGNPQNYWNGVLFYLVTSKGHALLTDYRALPRELGHLDLELRLERGVPVRLHVVDDRGVPYGRSTAALELDRNAANGLPSELHFEADADGWVELPRLPARTFAVWVHAGSPQTDRQRVELVVGTEPIEREIVVPRHDASLGGRVLLPDGTPATEGRIGIVPPDADRGVILTTGSTPIGSDGTFRAPGLAAGPFLLVASVPGYLPQWREIEVQPGEAQEGVELRLETRGRVRGRVVGWGDEAIADAEISIQMELVWREGNGHDAHGLYSIPITRTDAEGRFEIRGLDDEPVRLAVSCEGWVPAWPWPEVQQAGGEEAVFVMKPASEGRGMPFVARATVGGRPYEGELGATVLDPHGSIAGGCSAPVALGEGRYEMRVLFGPPGRYDLRFQAPGWRPQVVRGVELRHRPPAPEVDVALERGASLEVRVVDGDGHPLANRWLAYLMGQIQTDERGIFTISGLEAGALEHLFVKDPADPRYTYAHFESVPVPGTLDVVLRRCGRVLVRTPYVYRTLRHDLVFRVFDANGREVNTYTVPAGRYADSEHTASCTLQVFADGPYTIILETDGKRAETKVDARVGRDAVVSLDAR